MSANRGINCEPNILIPHRVTIAKIKAEGTKKGETEKKLPEEYVEETASTEELIASFSMMNNKHMARKWDKFLDNAPVKVLIIRPYSDTKIKKSPVRRMILTGTFYRITGELIPVPYDIKT